MRAVALLLLLFAAPAFAAPAPLPRKDRDTPAHKRERLMAERKAKLDELGVKWTVAAIGDQRHLRYDCRLLEGTMVVENGDLCSALGVVIDQVEEYIRYRGLK